MGKAIEVHVYERDSRNNQVFESDNFPSLNSAAKNLEIPYSSLREKLMENQFIPINKYMIISLGSIKDAEKHLEVFKSENKRKNVFSGFFSSVSRIFQ